MPQTISAEITVAFVNGPKDGKGKYGSIKTPELGYIGVPADLVGNFRKGGKYQIEYTLNGEYKNFHAFSNKPTQTAPLPDEQPSSEDHKALAIFVTGLVGRALGSGNFVAADIDGLTEHAVAAYMKHLSNG